MYGGCLLCPLYPLLGRLELYYCVHFKLTIIFLYFFFRMYNRTSYVPKKYFTSVMLSLCFIILVLHGRQVGYWTAFLTISVRTRPAVELTQYFYFQVERTARLLFLWKMEAFEKRTEVEKIRAKNRKLVDNILPEHVADYFLQHQSKDETVTLKTLSPFTLVISMNSRC